MSKQVLQISPPDELRFEGKFDSFVTTYLKLTNPTDKNVAFKIKTTEPKKYCVRPNCGVINPNATNEIEITLQPKAYDPNDKNKHKFMVQSMYAPDMEGVDVAAIWKDVQHDQLMDTKLKCVFDLLDELGKDVSSDTNRINITNELHKLNEESYRLKQENLSLKEDIMKLEQQTSWLHHISSKYEPPFHKDSNHILNMLMALLMVFIGYVLGRYIF